MQLSSEIIILALGYAIFISHNLLREAMRRSSHGQASLKSDKSSKLLLLYMVAVLLSPLLKLTGWPTFIDDWLQWSGIGLMLIGLAIHAVAMRTLRQHYTGNLQIVAKHQLVTSGIYSAVRHPGYLGNLLLGLGFGLASGSWFTLLVVLALYAIAYDYRMDTEEKMLAKEFGEQYRNYVKQTKRLIPFVY